MADKDDNREVLEEAKEGWTQEERRSEIRLVVHSWFLENRKQIVEIFVDANMEARRRARDETVKMMTEANLKAMDEWANQRSQRWLANFGRTTIGAMIVGGLAYLGWKGWGGK